MSCARSTTGPSRASGHRWWCWSTRPSDVVAGRLNDRQLDRFERAGDEFHERVLAGFRALAAADPGRWIAISATGPKDAIADEILGAVREKLSEQSADA